MRNKLLLGVAALALLGLIIPSFILGALALIVLSALAPLAGIALGFGMDIVFGFPHWLPQFVAYPFTLAALIIGLGSIGLSKYLR